MDLSRIGLGRQIAAGAAAVLLVSLFLPWYGIDAFGESVTFNAWDETEIAAFLLLVAGGGTLGIILAEAAGRLPAAMRFPPLQILQSLGGTAVIVMLLRLVDTPGELDRQWGLFVALLAAGAMAFGAYRAQQDAHSFL